MTKYLKPTISIAVVVWILWIFGVHVPLVANRARDQIKKGMPINQVTEIVMSHAKKPDLCDWEIENSKKTILSSRGHCDFPKQDIPLGDGGKSFKLTTLYMGPGYLHNDFKILFDNHGMMLAVSEVRHWD